MTDDLVKRLREGDEFERFMLAERAADRIEELERLLGLADDQRREWEHHCKATETKLEKAVEALEKLNVGEGWAAQIARTTLAELKEQE